MIVTTSSSNYDVHRPAPAPGSEILVPQISRDHLIFLVSPMSSAVNTTIFVVVQIQVNTTEIVSDRRDTTWTVISVSKLIIEHSEMEISNQY